MHDGTGQLIDISNFIINSNFTNNTSLILLYALYTLMSPLVEQNAFVHTIL